eukprot:gnl/Dysnectes_brevis/8118_a14243_287.p1 GENE.gnl/Dysnectes_brevis/8118_a14243_287~~gnl/Dysnectes_brevis/8118_a14243_287.p1  ORF type:complete len:302 (-),score=2.59 gnl/Dysnectes_brevis/8118_a14243_287:55-882(-)
MTNTEALILPVQIACACLLFFLATFYGKQSKSVIWFTYLKAISIVEVCESLCWLLCSLYGDILCPNLGLINIAFYYANLTIWVLYSVLILKIIKLSTTSRSSFHSLQKLIYTIPVTVFILSAILLLMLQPFEACWFQPDNPMLPIILFYIPSLLTLAIQTVLTFIIWYQVRVWTKKAKQIRAIGNKMKEDKMLNTVLRRAWLAPCSSVLVIVANIGYGMLYQVPFSIQILVLSVATDGIFSLVVFGLPLIRIGRRHVKHVDQERRVNAHPAFKAV